MYSLDTEDESNPLLIDKNEEKINYDYENVEEKFKNISKNIYLDYINNKISYVKFNKYSFLIKLIYFFLHEDKQSDLFIEVYHKTTFHNTPLSQLIKLIHHIYKVYQKKLFPVNENKINIGYA